MIVFILMNLPVWIDPGSGSTNYFNLSMIISAIIPYLFWVGYELDGRADRIFERSRSPQELDTAVFTILRYRLTTLPRRESIIAGLLPVIFLHLPMMITLTASDIFNLGIGRGPQITLLIFGAIAWWLIGTASFHTVHQLRVVRLIYTDYTKVNLFDLTPTYAFSRFAALTTIAIIVPVSISFAIIPQIVVQPIGLGMVIFSIFVAGATFVWPLLGAHDALVDEKERREAEIAERFEMTLKAIHAKMDRANLKGIGDLNIALAALKVERDAVRHVPTWPWRPETLRGVVASLTLPAAVWLIQWALQQFLD
jgi:hypothetical protein